MDLSTLITIGYAVRRRWSVAALVLVLVLSADIAITLQSPRTYLARASLLIGPSSSLDHGQLVYSVDALGRSMVVGTYANMLATDIVRREALMRLGISPEQGDTEIEIKSAALADSALVQVTAVARDPNLAAAVANAVGDVGEVRMSQFYPIYDLIVVTPATPPLSAYRPAIARNLSVGILLAVLLGVLSAYACDAVIARVSPRSG